MTTQPALPPRFRIHPSSKWDPTQVRGPKATSHDKCIEMAQWRTCSDTSLCQHSGILLTAGYVLGTALVAAVCVNNRVPIVSFWGLSDSFPNATCSFCERMNSGGQGTSKNAGPGFSSLPFLCSVFMAPVTGVLLQQFVSSALLLRLCIIYDLDSKMLVNCSTRNNGM